MNESPDFSLTNNKRRPIQSLEALGERVSGGQEPLCSLLAVTFAADGFDADRCGGVTRRLVPRSNDSLAHLRDRSVTWLICTR